MNTVMTMQVRELATDWNIYTIARIEKSGRKYTLKDVNGALVAEANSIDGIATVGHKMAQARGYFDAAFCGTAKDMRKVIKEFSA